MNCYKCGMNVDGCQKCAVCGFQAANKYVETVVTRLTAFSNFNEMIASMNGGYVPTIRPLSKRSRFLTTFIRMMGFRVFDGRKVG